MEDLPSVVRVFYSTNSDGQHKVSDDPEAGVNILMFKTLKITTETLISDLHKNLMQKLKVNNSNEYQIYSINESNIVKHKLQGPELVLELICGDVANNLKLCFLHDSEAKKLSKQEEAGPIEFYQWSNGKVINGKFPSNKEEWVTTEVLKHRKLLNSAFFPLMNLTFIIDGEKIYSLRAIIEKRCPQLLSAVNFIKKKKEKKGDFLGPITIEYKDGTFLNKFILMQILDWCYTGVIAYADLKLTDIMVILYSAQQFCISHLIFICEQYLRTEMTLDTVFIILKQAVMLKMEDVKATAIKYIHENWGQVATNREGMELIGLEMFQELTISMQTFQASGTQQNTENRRSSIAANQLVVNSLISDFREIYRDRMFTDGEAIFGDAPPVKFHRAILAAYSKPLFNIITQSKTKQISFQGLTPVAINDLIQFVYFAKTDLDPLGSCALIEHAISQLGLINLRDHCFNSIANGISLASVLPILRVTYLPHAKHRTTTKLRETLHKFICDHFDQVDIPSIRKLEPSIDVGYEILADLLESLYNSKSYKVPTGKVTIPEPLPAAAQQLPNIAPTQVPVSALQKAKRSSTTDNSKFLSPDVSRTGSGVAVDKKRAKKSPRDSSTSKRKEKSSKGSESGPV